MKRVTAAVLLLAFFLTIGATAALAQAEPESAANANLRGGHVWPFLAPLLV